MRMMKVPVHQIVDMIAVRNRLVPAMRTVLVAGFVPRAFMASRAIVGIGGVDPNYMLVVVIIVMVMQMAVVQVVDVAIVVNRRMTASRRMHVNMAASGVHLMMRHSFSLLPFVETAWFGETPRRVPMR